MLAYPPSSRALGANDRIRVGMIGVGGRGEDLLKQVLEVRMSNWWPSRTFTLGGVRKPRRWRPAFRLMTIIAVCWT